MIDLQKVCYAYEHEVALRYIDLHIEKGDSLVIQGPNGCGKSTLIKLLNGIIFPTEGHFFYKDHEITEKVLKDRMFAKWFHHGICVSECGYAVVLRKCRGRNCIWTDPDGTVRSRSP